MTPTRTLAAVLGLGLSAATVTLSADQAAAFPIAAPAYAGLSVYVKGSDDVIATYLGNTASYSNDLYLLLPGSAPIFVFNNHASPGGSSVNLGSFTPGTELVFQLYVRNTGYSFYTGAASRNPDGYAHAAVQADYDGLGNTLVSFEDLYGGPFAFNDLSFSFSNTSNEVPVVPLPATLPLLAGAMGLLALKRRRQNRA